MAEFLSLVLPLFFLAASTVGVVWVQFVESNLRIVAAEAVFLAAQADTTVGEVEYFAFRQIEERIGIPLAKVSVNRASGLAGVELGIEQSELVEVGAIFSPPFLVRSHGATEL